jgi:glucan endo-1,3-alpha-glucosidase
MSNVSQALVDVTQAKDMGLDAFALNVQQPNASWSAASIEFLFEAAAQTGFRLFFSMDMAVIPAPATFVPLFKQYQAHSAYYRYNGRPFLSTFKGAAIPNAAWQWQMRDAFSVSGINPFFVPDFDDWGGSTYTEGFFAAYPVVDGVMAWETAWPTGTDISEVSDIIDQANIEAAHAVGKVYMMPLSSFQSKHLDQAQNWFRRGGLGLPLRMQQVMALQPDFLEIISWNDAGEGHYIGHIWPEAIGGTHAVDLIDGFDHSAWQHVLAPFVVALKNGTADPSELVPFGDFAGSFWYRPLLARAECTADRFGLPKPSGWQTAVDAINMAVLLPLESAGVSIRVWSGGSVLAEFPGVPGMNMHQVHGIRTGRQKVELVGPNGIAIGAGIGGVDVTDTIAGIRNICNFNFQVVHIV